MSYFKREIYIFLSKVMCRWDGKKCTCEDERFWVRIPPPTTFAKKILALGTSYSIRCSWPWLLVSVFGYRFKNRYFSPSPTGAYGQFSSSGGIKYQQNSNRVSKELAPACTPAIHSFSTLHASSRSSCQLGIDFCSEGLVPMDKAIILRPISVGGLFKFHEH